MANQTTKKIKAKIMKDIEAKGTRKYRTTYADIKKYFNLINEGVFGGKLAPFNDITIKDLRRQKVYGQVLIYNQKRKGTQQLKLEMSDKYNDKLEFLATLGHEMVHLYQLANAGDTGNHNSLFYSFKPKLAEIGLGQI